jgi:hypothetical protein
MLFQSFLIVKIEYKLENQIQLKVWLLKLHITKHSSSLWLNYGQASEAAKAHPFTKPSLAKVQGRLECQTLVEIPKYTIAILRSRT